MASPRLIIIHGYMAAPEHHWFGWLQQQAIRQGMQVIIPKLPNSEAPQPDAWQRMLEQTVGAPDENTWLVGHSLGCITALRYLHHYADSRAGGLIMVSGFSEAVPGLEALDSFTSQLPDLPSIIRRVSQRAVIGSLDDEIVPVEYSLRLSQQLSAPFYGLPDHGHFLGQQGVTTLPLAEKLLTEFRSNSTEIVLAETGK